MIDNRQLLSLIRDRTGFSALDAAGWTEVIRLARREFLLGRLGVAAQAMDLPDDARLILDAARMEVAENQRALLWEIRQAARAFAGVEYPVILLKGGAYLGGGLRAGLGRIATDIDLLVPRAALDAAERALIARGWRADEQDPYDEQYYRAWMHEIPPLRHQDRGSVIDLHHSILPLTARPRLDPGLLIAAAVSCGDSGLLRLCDVDLFLHAAIHLFHDGDFEFATRNLIELGDLLAEFGENPEFWPQILPRAQVLGVARHAAYALRACARLLGTPVPVDIARHLPVWPLLWLMDRLVEATTVKVAAPTGRPRPSIARWLLYARMHWLKMPPLMLARHLFTKWRMRGRIKPG